MKNIIIKFGLLSGFIIIVSAIFTIALISDSDSFWFAEWLGYFIMVIAFSMIFIGIKDFKNKNNNIIDFKTAFKIGLGISLVASLMYIVGWEIYFSFNGEQFINDYSNETINNLIESGKSPELIDQTRSEISESMELYRFAPYRITITFFEIFPVALIITVISALILRTKKNN